MRRIAFFIVTVLLGSVATADPSLVQRQLATELVTLLHGKADYEAYQRQCIANGEADGPQSRFFANPSAFGGISPQSVYWPEIEEIFRRYTTDACTAGITADEYAEMYVGQIAEHLKEDDLRAAIAFYASPTGQRLVTLHIYEQVIRQEGKLRVRAVQPIRTRFNRDIEALVRTYQQKPE